MQATKRALDAPVESNLRLLSRRPSTTDERSATSERQREHQTV
jgi:hypothetical protein